MFRTFFVFRKAIMVKGKKIVFIPTPWSYNIQKNPPKMRASLSYSFGLKTEVDRGETRILMLLIFLIYQRLSPSQT